MPRTDCLIHVVGPAGYLVPKNIAVDVDDVRLLIEVDGQRWLATCRSVGLHRHPLSSLDLDEALDEALELAEQRGSAVLDSLSSVVL